MDSVQHLPLNFEWVAAQAGEDYHDRVQTLHRDWPGAHPRAQNRLSTVASFVDPYLAVRNLSMALAGTDLYTSLDFQRAGQQLPRPASCAASTATPLSHSKYGAVLRVPPQGRRLWASMPDFAYHLPALSGISPHYAPEVLGPAAVGAGRCRWRCIWRRADWRCSRN
ncbi:MAG: DUF3526 domain-containing protein [Hymenobacter sp.]